MSFSVDLWNGYDIIKTSFNSNLKKMNQLTEFLTLYSSVLKDYIKNLSNLYQFEKESIEKQNEAFVYPFNILIKVFKEEIEIYKNHYNFIITNIKEIKEKIDKMKIEVIQNFNTIDEKTNYFDNILNILISKQDNFNNNCKELCLTIAEEEANKILEGINEINDKKIINIFSVFNNKKDKKERKDDILEKIFLAKNDYILSISNSNEEREKYNKEIDILLFNLQRQYKNLIYYYDKLLKDFAKDKIKIFNEISELNKLNNEKTFKNLNYRKDFDDFIIKNATKEFPMNKLDFFPFKLNKIIIENQTQNKFNKCEKNDQNKIFDLIKNYFSEKKINFYENDFAKKFLSQGKNLYKGKNLLKENENEIIIEEKVKDKAPKIIENEDDFEIINSQQSEEKKEKMENFNFIKDFIYTLVIEDSESNKKEKINIIDNNKIENNNEDIDEDESIKYNKILIKFMDLITPKRKGNFEYLNFFISYLTINRAKGLFKFNKNVYQIFLNIFKYILMNYKNSYDYVKNVIILAQTFYKGDDKDPNNKKVYLLNGLKDHTVFNEPETWHRAINYNLSLSIKNGNRYSMYIINKDEYITHLNMVAMNSVISYLYDMKICTSDTNVYEKVKNFYSKVYKLDEKIIDQQINEIFLNDNKSKEINNKPDNQNKGNNTQIKIDDDKNNSNQKNENK